jgi:serine/threonine-protein kinase OSR1/STK39
VHLQQTFVGTPCWMAPEVMEQQRGYNEKADIWSVGITALELAKGYAPYSKYAPMQVLLKTIREPPPSLKSYVDPPGVAPLQFSEKFTKFVARCLQKDPRAR